MKSGKALKTVDLESKVDIVRSIDIVRIIDIVRSIDSTHMYNDCMGHHSSCISRHQQIAEVSGDICECPHWM